MNIITSFIEFIKSAVKNLGDNPTKASLIFEGIGTAIAGFVFLWSVICFLDGKLVKYLKSDKNKAKNLLKEYNTYISTMLKNESVFFNEDDPRKILFYKRVPIKKYNSGKKSCLAKLKRSSYILLGEAGSGKSSIIKKDYLYHCNKFKCFWRIRSGIVYINQQFLNHNITGMSSLEEIIKCAHDTKYKKIYLYIDGIDEFGENQVGEIFKALKPILTISKKVKITCRTNFAIQNMINAGQGGGFSFKENQRYIVEKWREKNLKNLFFFLLKNLKIKRRKRKEITTKINETKWFINIDSPLLVKFYLYILMHGDQNRNIDFSNKYAFYTQFIVAVILTQRKRRGNYKTLQIQSELDDISVSVFDAFSSNKKHIKYTESISPILKSKNNENVHFVHETFFEYFVARNYLLQISKKHSDEKSIKALCQTYTNNFADFITSAFNDAAEDVRKQIAHTLFTIYYSTLNEEVRKKYIVKFSDLSSRISSATQTQTYRVVQQLPDQQYFILKYEIIFRLGRIGVCSDEIINFLNFVYENDENIKLKIDYEYYVAVLKRCCAISCSFFGEEKSELDYVKRMLPINNSGKKSNYIPYYDLANRTHTILFYGDVSGVNIFNFRDNETSTPFACSFSKRIERLHVELPENITYMNNQQKKTYYFRVFDLATIYTFMYNRRRALSATELRIVSCARIKFEGASDARNNVMKELQALIIQLNNELNAS